MTVYCPGCGGDWELTAPVGGELTTETCECGVTLELDAAGVVRTRAPEGRRPEPDVAVAESRPPRPIGTIVRDILGPPR